MCFYSKVFIPDTTFADGAYDGESFRGPILVSRWPGSVHLLPTPPIGGSKSRQCAFHPVSGSCAVSTTEWGRVDRIGDVQEVEG